MMGSRVGVLLFASTALVAACAEPLVPEPCFVESPGAFGDDEADERTEVPRAPRDGHASRPRPSTPPSSLGLLPAPAPIPPSSSTIAATIEASTQAELSQSLPDPLPGRADGCAAGMVRVEGEYCPEVIQICAEYHDEYRLNGAQKNVSERCLRYIGPTRCAVKQRKHLSFCMDRFEYPNVVGEPPRVLTSWLEARDRCASQGKRLCSEEEFNFACEGPEMLPYVYGYERDPSKCNIDKPYVRPDQSRVLPTMDHCMETPWCAAEIARLDQREKIGQRTSCVSWSGIFDLNGNVNEWVEVPGQKPPRRSGLKGGWWGPVRGRCRPTVTFHKEDDYGYEQGFRCCNDSAVAP